MGGWEFKSAALVLHRAHAIIVRGKEERRKGVMDPQPQKLNPKPYTLCVPRCAPCPMRSRTCATRPSATTNAARAMRHAPVDMRTRPGAMRHSALDHAPHPMRHAMRHAPRAMRYASSLVMCQISLHFHTFRNIARAVSSELATIWLASYERRS